MRLTRFTDYSLRVLVHLGQNNAERVTIHQISETYSISKNHLMKVVSNLTRLQFVIAQRGPGGGIRLNRPPEEISLKEVVGNTEKHLQLLDSTSFPETNGITAEARLNSYLHHALQAYLETLGGFTLADVLEADVHQTLPLNKKTA